MSSPPPTKQDLASGLLGQNVLDWIAERRDPDDKRSWRMIARQLRVATEGEVDVTGETIRLWHMGQPQPQDAA